VPVQTFRLGFTPESLATFDMDGAVTVGIASPPPSIATVPVEEI